MSGPVTRRGLVQASAAALGAVSLPVATVALANALPAPASPDVALLVLVTKHVVATDAWNVLGEQWDDLFDRWQEEKPERPAALNARYAEGLGAYPVRGRRSDGTMGLIYDEVEVEQIRAGSLRPKWMGSDDLDRVAVARKAEVLTAFDTWKAECDALADRLGLPEAEAKASAAYLIVERLETDIIAYRPTTLAGFILKAQWIKDQSSNRPWAEQIVQDLCALGQAT